MSIRSRKRRRGHKLYTTVLPLTATLPEAKFTPKSKTPKSKTPKAPKATASQKQK